MPQMAYRGVRTSFRGDVKAASLLWYAKLDKETNQLAYCPTSVLTQMASGRVPLAGRSFKVGLQASFCGE